MKVTVEVELEDGSKFVSERRIDLLEERLFLDPRIRFLWQVDAAAKEVWEGMEKARNEESSRHT